ncbi:hypothetical protein [Azospirillum sp. SYSU D00513]|uniref:hypothetical protein n=1 Tax=Azospirillum sp. SYSU D00513 TaxID=2812561 RepID=UPI001A96A1D3|nr:hypothetical protein [Azospirillum sp. SYSU D00513]
MNAPTKKPKALLGSQQRRTRSRFLAVRLRKALEGIAVSRNGTVVGPRVTMIEPKAVIAPKRGGVKLGQHAHLGLKLED